MDMLRVSDGKLVERWGGVVDQMDDFLSADRRAWEVSGSNAGRVCRCAALSAQAPLRPLHRTLVRTSRLANARRAREEIVTGSQPVRDLSPGCAAGEVTGCHCVANGWFSNHDGRRLRRDLLALLAELED